MKKRIGSGVLALCLLLALLPGNAWAAEGDTPSIANNPAELQELFDDADVSDIKLADGGSIVLQTTPLKVPKGREVTLDLNDVHINSYITTAIIVEGKLTVKDSKADPDQLKYENIDEKDELPLYQRGSITAGNVTTKRDAIHVQNNGVFVLQSGTVSATNIAIAVEAGSTATINSGYVKAREFAVLVRGQDAEANINGGILLSEDNAVVAGNGLPQNAGTTINMSGGTLVSKITITPGYIPCGIYHPQKGTLSITGGEIRAPGGVGILMRGGSLNVGDNVTKDKFDVDSTQGTKGKVGDASREIEAGDIIAMDRQDGYYDGANVKVTLTKAADLVEELRPTAYHPEGLDLLWTESDDTTIYTIGKKTTTAHTVTFNLNYTGAPAPTTAKVNDGGKLATLPADPIRTDYTFLGWYTSNTGGDKVTTDTVFTKDTTVYAMWKSDSATNPVTYTVTFYQNENDTTAYTTKTTNADGAIEWPAAPTKEGFIFKGWANEDDDPYSNNSVFFADTKLYAQWEQEDPDNPDTPKIFTITLDANGGTLSGAATVTTNAKGMLDSLPAAPTREGYSFEGWFTAASDGEKVDFQSPFKEDSTIYAQWTKDGEDPSDEDEYRIYAPSSVTGGRLYVSHRTAAPGTRVTIELRPWSDYELDWLSVVNLDTDRELRLTERYTDEYTFTMPSSDVEVDVSYTDRYYNNYYGGTYYVREVVPAEPKPVKWYYSNGSIVHVTDGMVPYGGQLTRDMLLSVLYNMDPARSGDPTIWAADKGIIPDIYISVLWGVDKPITREQTAMILYCFAQHMGYNTAPATSLTGYADYRQISDAARPAVAWAKAAGLIAGTSPNTLSPGAVLTCGQANAILARFTANVARTW